MRFTCRVRCTLLLPLLMLLPLFYGLAKERESTLVLPSPPADRPPPPLGRPKRIEANILRYEVRLPSRRKNNRLWVYLPARMPKPKIPVIFIAPAGSHLIDGMKLGEGDVAEHLPYVRAGFAVVAYEIDGDWPETTDDEPPSVEVIKQAAEEFRMANAGCANLHNALDYALVNINQLDTGHVYVVGHSSAGTLALYGTSQDPRIDAVVAFAPVTDIRRNVGVAAIMAIDFMVTGFGDFLRWTSPINTVNSIKRPVFIFQATDDEAVEIQQTRDFVTKLKETNPKVTFVEVKEGGHYLPMVSQGIPQAIKWLKALP